MLKSYRRVEQQKDKLVSDSLDFEANSVKGSVKLVHVVGMHARPAAELVKIAGRFKCGVELRKDELTVNGKSIMGVMMLAAECGSSIFIKTDGEDAEACMEALLALVADGFHEMHLTGSEADEAAEEAG